MLFASVPPEVNITSSNPQFIKSATCWRDLFKVSFDCIPKWWVDEGLPKFFEINWFYPEDYIRVSAINFLTSGWIGVVPL